VVVAQKAFKLYRGEAKEGVVYCDAHYRFLAKRVPTDEQIDRGWETV
jgi:hypothetical protein